MPPVLPASRYGQDVASHYAQAWIDKYVKHDPAADDALLAPRHVEPGDAGPGGPAVVLLLPGYDIGTASGRQVYDDIAGVGCP